MKAKDLATKHERDSISIPTYTC